MTTIRSFSESDALGTAIGELVRLSRVRQVYTELRCSVGWVKSGAVAMLCLRSNASSASAGLRKPLRVQRFGFFSRFLNAA